MDRVLLKTLLVSSKVSTLAESADELFEKTTKRRKHRAHAMNFMKYTDLAVSEVVVSRQAFQLNQVASTGGVRMHSSRNLLCSGGKWI
jgi:hypothetical protein